MAGVRTVRRELLDIKKKYQLISDALEGEQAVKDAGERYLPKPNDMSVGSESDARYKAYSTRAVYYNVVKPTQDALVGQIFLRPPKIKLPSLMQGLEKNANGENLDLEQLIRSAANYLLPYGRCGLLADFPSTMRETTLADIENGLQPTLKVYAPWAIINWRTEKIQNVQKLVLLVVVDKIERKDVDEFVVTFVDKHTVYRLRENVVTVQIYEDEQLTQVEKIVLDAGGEPLSEIPFEFIGSTNNDSEMDDPPLYPMATLNIAHFRNSADYEESVFLTGQPTPVYSGLTEDWVDSYFKGGIPFGSRASIPLPEGAEAKLLQASPNTLAFEAMKHKEDQMVAIGAKLINPKNSVERKEAEIQIDAASQRSVLTTIKDNLQKAFLSGLNRAAKFVGTEEEIELVLNDNFDLTSLTGEELRWLMELLERRAIDFDSFHENLRRSGIVKNTALEARSAILGDLEFFNTIAPPVVQTQTDKKDQEDVES